MPAEDGPLTRALRATGRFLLRTPLALVLLLAALWALLIFDLSSHPVPPPSSGTSAWEFLSNLAHAPLFGTLALLLAAALLRERDGGWPRPRRARCALVLLVTVGYGALDEFHQSHVPGRDSSVLDVLSDLVAASLVLWIVFRLARRELRERELVASLAWGVLLCCVSAALATVG